MNEARYQPPQAAAAQPEERKRRDRNRGAVRSAAKIFFLCVLTLAMTMLCACGGQNSDVIVAGSTSVQPFAEALAEEYMRLNPDVIIDIQGGGSSAGIMASRSDTADIGMSSRELADEESDLWYVEIAKDGLAVIVHPGNPIANLTLEQVSRIYTGEVTNWSELGGADSKIHVIAREDGSGTRAAFESLVMDSLEITPKAMVQDSNGAVRQLVEDDSAAIGFISLGLVNESVKALELDGVPAARENIENGTYGLSRPFLFISHAEPAGEAKEFIDFTLSAQGQKLLAAEGLIPVGEGESK